MLDIDYHTVMLDMHRKCAPGDQVVGWWSAGGGENPGSDALFQQFFTSQVEDGVYLQVDTALSGGRMAVKCYKAESMVLDEEEGTVRGLFHRVTITTGRGHAAWAYAYGGGLDLTPIQSGDWLAR